MNIHQRESSNHINEKIIVTNDILKSYGLDDIVGTYPFVKKYSVIFLGLIQQGVENFYVHGEGNNAIIIMADNGKDAGGFVIKIPKKNDYRIAKEYQNHRAFLTMLYEGYSNDDPVLKKVIIPQINSLSSQEDQIIVMDRLPGKSIKRVLLEYLFKPLFANPKHMSQFELSDVANDMEIIDVLQKYVQKAIDHGEIYKEEIVVDRHKNRGSIQKIIDEYIGLRGIDDKKYLAILQEAMGEKKGQEVRETIHHFQKYSAQHGCEHTDLNNAGNIYVMGTPSNRQVGIIDFGSATVKI